MSRQVIVYNGDDGFCNVVIPSEECVLSDADIIAKDVPVAEYAMIDHTALPTSLFRNAWKYNHSSSAVDVDPHATVRHEQNSVTPCEYSLY